MVCFKAQFTESFVAFPPLHYSITVAVFGSTMGRGLNEMAQPINGNSTGTGAVGLPISVCHNRVKTGCGSVVLVLEEEDCIFLAATTAMFKTFTKEIPPLFYPFSLGLYAERRRSSGSTPPINAM